MKTRPPKGDRRAWVPATPAYYWGTIAGASAFVLPSLALLTALLFVIVGVVPTILASPSAGGRLLSFAVTGLFLALGLALVVVVILTLRSAVDRLWVTTTRRDHLLNLHRAWYDACTSVDPGQHAELWPKRPY